MSIKKNSRGHRCLGLEALETRLTPAVTEDFSRILANPTQFAANRMLITLSPATQPNYRMGAYGPGIQLTRSFSIVPDLYEARLTGTTVARALQSLARNNIVVTASPNMRIDIAQTPNDSQFSRLFGMNNTGQTGGRPDADIDATEAWDRATGTGGTIVAVIDTGIDYNHPDLAANVWTNLGEIAGNGRDDDGNGYIDDIHGYNFVANNGNPMDDNGHGTHVSGTIAGVGDNGIGVAGVNWNGKLMGLKFLDSTGSGFLADAVAALDYAVRMGAKISNNSWAGGGYEALMARAIANARTAGHIFVAAAGNEAANNNITATYPANYNYDNVVSVAAVDHNDNLAYFSNYGSTSVDIAAPGVNIYSTLPNNRYGTYSGTSMAAPHVSGALSLLWDSEPNLTYRQVINRLYAGADQLASLNNRVVASRRLNVNGMIAQAPTTPPIVVDAAPVVSTVIFSQGAAGLTGATITFSEDINPSTINVSDFTLVGPNGPVVVTGVEAANTGDSRTFRVAFASSSLGSYALTIGPDIADLTGNLMDQNGNGTTGEANDAFVANVTMAGSLSFTNSTAVPIRDYRNTISTIVVGQSFKVADLNVSVNLNHTYVGDLIITLKSPTNKVVTLFKRRGGDGQNLVNTVFDDESTALLQNSTAPFTGSFKPETVLSAFDGSMAKGTWTLTVSDRAWYDTGTFNSWQMDFVPAQAATSQRAPSSKSALRSIEITDATLASFSTTTPNSTSFANGSGITPRPIEASVQLVTEVVARAPAQTTAHASTPRRLARANSWADHALWSRF